MGNRAYPILIGDGLLAHIGVDLRKRAIAKRYVIISDQRVADLWADRLLASLAEGGIVAQLLTFPAGEASKTMATVTHLASALAQRGTDRKDGLIALGGGVTGDISGFLAAIYMRGIPFVQVPTTLLAQVDSSVGGKTGVDIPEGKNLVGSFYQPRCVYIDSRTLQTLPPSEFLNGLAEVIKYGVIYDRDFFEFLRENRQAILDLQLPVVEDVIHSCCTIKARVVEADEREADLRRILNFGHTIGHAVEAASNYALAHGMAVAMGMVAAAELAVAKLLLPRKEAELLRDLISSFGLPTALPKGLDKERIKQYLKTDKKAVSGRPFFILPTAIGKVMVTDDVSEDLIERLIS